MQVHPDAADSHIKVRQIDGILRAPLPDYGSSRFTARKSGDIFSADPMEAADMNIQQARHHCLSLPGTSEEEAGAPYNIHVFKVGNKKFAYFKTSEPEKFRFSVRVSPSRFIGLTDQPGIKPARYMHRFHWITIVNVALMPEDYLKELIEWSYSKAVGSLTKTRQKALRAIKPIPPAVEF